MIPLSEFIDGFRKRSNDQLLDQDHKIVGHRAPDFETYLVEWGVREGMRRAREEFDELVKRVYE